VLAPSAALSGTPSAQPAAGGGVLVMGAGSVGCFIGGRLQAAGTAVDFVGRPRVLADLAREGLTLTDHDGGHAVLPATALQRHAGVPAGANPALVLLCVKSGATADAARELAAVLPPGTTVVSLQNGVGNVATARAAAPALTWLPGMVPFNIAELGPGRFHRGTQGELAAQAHPSLIDWAPRFAAAGLPLHLHDDLAPVQWGKLLLNLNNAVNALSGLPLRAQLLDTDLRQCFAALVDETLGVLATAGIRPARLTPLPPHWLPRVLRLPTPLFRQIAARMLKVDARARSSMADDLALGRPTETDALQGEGQRLALAQGRTAPLCARISTLVQGWPARPQPFDGPALKAALNLR